MKKYIIGFLLGLVTASTITVGAAHIFNANDVYYTPRDESWDVNNTGEAIESLKSDLAETKSSISQYKKDITSALSSKGINVDENTKMEDIVTGINDMRGGTTYYLGTGTTIDVKSLFPNEYMNFTVDNFIVGTSYVGGLSAGYTSSNSYHSSSSSFSGLSLKKSYDATNGILTITGNSYSVKTCIDSSEKYCNDRVNYSTTTPFTYLIIGEIISK